MNIDRELNSIENKLAALHKKEIEQINNWNNYTHKQRAAVRLQVDRLCERRTFIKRELAKVLV